MSYEVMEQERVTYFNITFVASLLHLQRCHCFTSSSTCYAWLHCI